MNSSETMDNASFERMLTANLEQRRAPGQPLLEVARLCQSVHSGARKLVILEQLSLSVCRGDTLAIIGRSGVGKSTLLGLLAGLDRPTSGEVKLAGFLLSRLDEDQRAAIRAQLLGFVFQSFQLLPGLTALENIALPLELGAAGTDITGQAQAALQQVGLAARAEHYPHQLSGGEQQRVAIARAFATRPQLLLADEPTGNLDEETGAQVIDLLFELNRSSGTTLILVTHDRALASRCQRQLLLHQGALQPLEQNDG